MHIYTCNINHTLCFVLFFYTLLSLCLTNQALSGFCGFMAANLYARSIFGEDALANVSIEKPIHLGPEAPVNGHIRIRAKSQVGLSCCATSFYATQRVKARLNLLPLM